METEHNPYQTPRSSEPSREKRNHEQASRWARLGAVLIDGLAQLALIMPLQWMTGSYDNFPDIEPQGPSELLMWFVISFGVTLLLNGYLLATRAQSIGKVFLGIKIVTLDGKNADFNRIVLRRILPLTVAVYIPILGSFVGFIDALFIFRKDRRCGHDLIAGTRVVRA